MQSHTPWPIRDAHRHAMFSFLFLLQVLVDLSQVLSFWILRWKNGKLLLDNLFCPIVSMKYTTVIKDASWQVIGRVASGLSGLIVVGMLTPLLGPLRFSDYATILTFFAFRSAFADLGLYSMWLKELGALKGKLGIGDRQSYRAAPIADKEKLAHAMSQFVRSRLTQIALVYIVVLIAGYCIPSYAHNPYIVRGLPIGMLFSALFMAAGIIQLPLQLFRKMHHVSIALILARVSQIIFLVVVLYSGRFSFDTTGEWFPLLLFLLVLGSVLVSSLTQTMYTLIMSWRVVPLRRTPYLRHMITHIVRNGRYGLASVFNSFHLLIVWFAISLWYPTIKWFAYVGIWWLALQLLQVLLIIPASLSNSVLHKISAAHPKQQRQWFGWLWLIITRCAGLFFSNFVIFSSSIVNLIAGSKYVTTTWWWWKRSALWSRITRGLPEWASIWSDVILSVLGIALFFIFLTNVYSYVFIAANKQKSLFPINAGATIVGWWIALVLVYFYGLLGGVVGTLLMELLFFLWSVWIASQYSITPQYSQSLFWWIVSFFLLMSLVGFVWSPISYDSMRWFIWFAVLYNIAVFTLRFHQLKRYFKSLTDTINYPNSI